MKNQKRISFIIRLIARIWSSFILLFLLFFIGAHVFGSGESDYGGFNSVGEKLIFYLTFPVGTMVGLAIAWKWEGLGGLIATGSIIGLFIARPDLLTNPLFIGMGLIGVLFLLYWALTWNRQFESTSIGKERHKIKRNNIGIALLISLLPLGVFVISMIQNRDKSFITTEKDSYYNKKVEQVEVIVKVEEPLIPYFAHSFEHSLASALKSNGVEAIVSVNASEPDSQSNIDEESGAFMPVASLRIHIKPIYRTRDDGYEAIVGTDYEASLIDMETEKKVWHAAGKEDYIAMFPSHYEAGEDIRKEFAWSTTESIVNAFIAELNGQEPAPVYTGTEDMDNELIRKVASLHEYQWT